MTYYARDRFATNEVVGAIAAAMLHDLHVNNFTFPGFPSVEVLRDTRVDGFSFRLALGSDQSRAIEMSFAEGKALARAFQAKKQIPEPWMRRIQDLVVDIERLASQRRG